MPQSSIALAAGPDGWRCHIGHPPGSLSLRLQQQHDGGIGRDLRHRHIVDYAPWADDGQRLPRCFAQQGDDAALSLRQAARHQEQLILPDGVAGQVHQDQNRLTRRGSQAGKDALVGRRGQVELACAQGCMARGAGRLLAKGRSCQEGGRNDELLWRGHSQHAPVRRIPGSLLVYPSIRF